MHPPLSNPSQASRAYRSSSVLTSSPEKLVVLLYDGALKHVDRAEQAIATARRAEVGESIGRAFAIVGELRTALDFEQGGEVAHELNRLYGFVLDQLVAANRTRSAAPLAGARSVLQTLKEGWDGILRAS